MAHRGPVDELTMAMEHGTRFGAYEIAESIGAGGMGVVYRATDTKLKRDVAIKVLPESLATDAERLARFQREAEMLASLNHPNIAQIYGLEETDGTTALILELVEGPTLQDRIEQGAIPVDGAIGIAMQIAEALEAAHGRGIVHRDLKPANIKLKEDGTVKVLDFGIAKALEPDALTSEPASRMLTTPATQVGVILGTAQYMAPEQAKGKAVDQRADIWAFGCVLYEMLTGQPAFGGEDVPTTLARVLEREIDLGSLPAAVTPAVRQTIALCLQKDLRQRLYAIADARLALEGAFEVDQPQGTDDVAAVARTWRRAPQLAASIAVGAALTALGAWSLWPAGEERIVTRFFYDLPEGLSLGDIGRAVVSVSPDGRQFVYSTEAGLFVRSMQELEARLISGTVSAQSSPVFSPDGEAVAYWDASSRQLKRIATSGGAATVIADLPGNLQGMSWPTDDTILLGQREGIYRVSATGGTPELIIPIEEGRIFGPELLPDGDTILFSLGITGGWDDAQILAQSISTGERTVLVNGGSHARYLPTGHLVYALGDVLLAAAFDPDTLTVSGGPVPLIQGVMRGSAGNTGAAQMDISDNGTLVYVAGGTGGLLRSVVWANRDGSAEELPIEPSNYFFPRISPDGTRAVLDDWGVGRHLWVWDFAAETRTRLTIGETGGVYPVWTADGTRIAYSPRAGDVDWRAANNTGMPENIAVGLAERGAGGTFPFFFSEPGDGLVFRAQRNSDTGDDIGMVATDGATEPTWLLDGPYNERNADISPDGRWMIYESDESGRWEIYVRPFPNVEDDRIPLSNNGGEKPVWSKDGSEIFYLESGAPNRLISVTVDSDGNSFSFGARSRVMDWPYVGIGNIQGRPYDVSLDGQRFLALRDRSSDQTTVRVIVVQNWFEELERLVPRDE